MIKVLTESEVGDIKTVKELAIRCYRIREISPYADMYAELKNPKLVECRKIESPIKVGAVSVGKDVRVEVGRHIFVKFYSCIKPEVEDLVADVMIEEAVDVFGSKILETKIRKVK